MNKIIGQIYGTGEGLGYGYLVVAPGVILATTVLIFRKVSPVKAFAISLIGSVVIVRMFTAYQKNRRDKMNAANGIK